MIKLIVGVKGTGKTKAIIEEVNKAVEASKGSVICVEYGAKLNYEIKPQARLIDANEYKITDAATLYGFLCGILAGNYDVTELFVDSALKICGNDIFAFEKFVLAFNKYVVEGNIHCVMTASLPIENLPESLKPLISAEK